MGATRLPRSLMVDLLGGRHTEYCEGLCGALGEAGLSDIPAGTTQPKICGDRMHFLGWLCLQVSHLFVWDEVTFGSSSEIRAPSDIRPAPQIPFPKAHYNESFPDHGV